MPTNSKLQKILKLMMLLTGGIRYSRNEIMKRLQIDERTFYRYLNILREAGFVIPKPENSRYSIDKNSPFFSEISELLYFSREEAVVLYNALHAISDDNILKQNLQHKLFELYDFGDKPDVVVKPEHATIIHELMQARKYRSRVILEGYLSANSNSASDRLVEPFGFTTNFVAVWAFDVNAHSCKTFKISRIRSVQTLSEPWQYESRHKRKPLDVFRISSDEKTKVRLRLSIRAAELLKEEYPNSESYITQTDDTTFIFEGPVSGYEGVGRFILGLPGEIEVMHPNELMDFVRNKAKKIFD